MQQRDPRAFLWDAREAALAVQTFTAGMDAACCASNEMAQAPAVQRKWEVIGEALGQPAKQHPTLATLIRKLPQIVAFRNQLIRGTVTVKAGVLARCGTRLKTRCPCLFLR